MNPQRIVATYDYTDGKSGEMQYQVVRYGPKKDFRQRRPNGSDWTWSLNGVKPTLYRLPGFLASIRQGEPLWVVEGEKDVDRLRAEGLAATCNSGGAGKWPDDPTLNAMFSGVDVYIVPDRDASGERHAEDVAQKLAPFAKSIRLVRLSAPHKDVSDYLADGAPVADLITLAERSPLWGPEHGDAWEPEQPDDYTGEQRSNGVGLSPEIQRDLEEARSAPRPRYPIMTAEDLLEQPDPEQLVHGVIGVKGFAAIIGLYGSAKTFLALLLAFCVAAGLDWCGRGVRQGAVLYISGEGVSGLKKRLRALIRHYVVTRQVPLYFLTVSVSLMEDPAELLEAIRNKIPEGVVLIVIDTLSRSMPGAEENSSKDMSHVVETVDLLREQTGAAVLPVHHMGWTADRSRGSTVLPGALDSELTVSKEGDEVTVECSKQKDWAPFVPIRLRLTPVGDSCVLVPDTGLEDTLPEPALRALRALDEITTPEEQSSSTVWLESSGLSRPTFHRMRKILLAHRCVAQDTRKRYKITDEGRAAMGLRGSHNSSENTSIQVSREVRL